MVRALVLCLLAGGALGCGSDDAPAGDGGVAMRDAAVRADAGARADGGPQPPADWSIVVLPDTQILARSFPEIFEAQTRWILDQEDALNIELVLHVGDLVDDNGGAQWDVARSSMGLLDGRIPYVMAPGNHDYGVGGSAADRSTMMNAYFPVSLYEAWPSFGGTFTEGSIESSYHVFDTPTGPWLVVALEFGPRDDVVEWADEVIRRHAPMPTIVVTHAYLYSDDTRYDWLARPDQMWNPHGYGLAAGPGGVNDGEEMFQSFIRQNDDVDVVVCGHVLNDGIGRLTSEQDEGGRVHQLLANFQHQPEGGAGFLRIMTFRADGSRVDVRTYSPYLDEHLSGSDHEFSLEL